MGKRGRGRAVGGGGRPQVKPRREERGYKPSQTNVDGRVTITSSRKGYGMIVRKVKRGHRPCTGAGEGAGGDLSIVRFNLT